MVLPKIIGWCFHQLPNLFLFPCLNPPCSSHNAHLIVCYPQDSFSTFLPHHFSLWNLLALSCIQLLCIPEYLIHTTSKSLFWLLLSTVKKKILRTYSVQHLFTQHLSYTSLKHYWWLVVYDNAVMA